MNQSVRVVFVAAGLLGVALSLSWAWGQSSGTALVRSVFPLVLGATNRICVYGRGLNDSGVRIFVGDRLLSRSSSVDGCPPALGEVRVAGTINTNGLFPGRNYRVIAFPETPTRPDSNPFFPPVIMVEAAPRLLSNESNPERPSGNTYSIIEGQVMITLDPNRIKQLDGVNDLNSVLFSLGLNRNIVTTLKIANGGNPFVRDMNGTCGKVIAVLQGVNGTTTAEVMNEVNRIRQGSMTAQNVILGLDPVPHTVGPSFGDSTQTLEPRAQAMGKSYSGVGVAVVDSGFTNHNDLTPKSDKVFTNQDYETAPIGGNYEDKIDDGVPNGHGTPIASIIAGQKYGVARGANIQVLKACRGDRTCTGLPVVAAICSSIRTGAKVLNLSLNSLSESRIIESALRDVSAAGISIVTSAGNRGCDKGKSLMGFPARYATPTTVKANGVTLPEYDEIPGLIAVGADAEFSSCGDWVNVLAPGTLFAAWAGTTGEFKGFRGTSFSAAYVSGIAARLWAGDKYAGQPLTKTPTSIKAAIMNNASPSSLPKLYNRGMVTLPK